MFGIFWLTLFVPSETPDESATSLPEAAGDDHATANGAEEGAEQAAEGKDL